MRALTSMQSLLDLVPSRLRRFHLARLSLSLSRPDGRLRKNPDINWTSRPITTSGSSAPNSSCGQGGAGPRLVTHLRYG